MDFNDLSLPTEIRTTEINPISEFFNPVLKLSVSYDIAVGYFTSSWIRDAAEGIASLALNDGRSRWVISPQFSEEDWNMFQSLPNTEKTKWIYTKTEFSLSELIKALREKTHLALAWLIRDGILQFRVAVPKNNLSGIFHAKMGLFKDALGNRIAFVGSYNMTRQANTNWEHIEIFRDGLDNSSRIDSKEFWFNKIWNDKDENLSLYKPSEKALKSFVSITQRKQRPYQIKDKESLKIPLSFLNEDSKLRSHQEKAIEEWFSRGNGRGLFTMATGAGKTVTALSTIIRLIENLGDKKNCLFVIITVPYKNLAEQWEKEASAFGFKPLICYDTYEKWVKEAEQQLTNFTLNIGENKVTFWIVVNRTFISDRFQRILKEMESIGNNLFLIADEVHNLGGKKISCCLHDFICFRLGLSATPFRHYDQEGSQIINDYFGEEVGIYPLEQAISDRVLCQYYYYPELVDFTKEEMEKYCSLSTEIARLFSKANGDIDIDSIYSERLKRLLIQRARLIGTAENKLNRLRELLIERRETSYNLIYCGDGKYEDERQVETVIRLAGSIKIKIGKYTSEANKTRRHELEKGFAEGHIQAIAAIRCLDEGVDIPRTETAYILASSTNPRQFIQRRGRVLRRFPGKNYAYIYDFIVVPDVEKIRTISEETYNFERNLLKRELSRISEFSLNAVNGTSLEKLRPYRIQWNLLDS